MSISPVDSFIDRMSLMSLSPSLEKQLPSLKTSEEIETLLSQGCDFKCETILSDIFDEGIPLSKATLQRLVDNDAICSPTAEEILIYLTRLEDWESEESFPEAFSHLVEAMPPEQQATTEMLHIAFDNRLPMECINALLAKGAVMNYVTYVKATKCGFETEWMKKWLPQERHPFVDYVLTQQGNPEEILTTHEITSEVLNLAVEIEMPDDAIMYMIQQRGVPPDRSTQHKLYVRGDSPVLMELVNSYFPEDQEC